MKEIDKLILQLYMQAFESHNKRLAQTILQAFFSVQYCSAVGLTRGSVPLDNFSQEKIKDEKIRGITVVVGSPILASKMVVEEE